LEKNHLLFSRIEAVAVGETRTTVSLMREVWTQFHRLASLVMHENVKITEEQWLTEARAWGRLYVSAFSKKDVTTYIHISSFILDIFWNDMAASRGLPT
jgi:hypothetical protein